MEQLSRRQFVAAVTAAAACASCAACGMAAEAGAPGTAPAAPPAGEKVAIGTLADYGKDGIYDKFAKDKKFFVIRESGELYAASAICTHKNAQLTVNGNTIVCKKHGSKFSEHGTVTKGPAKYSLPRYGISKDDAGKLTVDTSKSFGEKEWEKDGVFVKVA